MYTAACKNCMTFYIQDWICWLWLFLKTILQHAVWTVYWVKYACINWMTYYTVYLILPICSESHTSMLLMLFMQDSVQSMHAIIDPTDMFGMAYYRTTHSEQKLKPKHNMPCVSLCD